MKDIVKLGLILAAFAAAACVGLAFVNQATEGQIAINQEKQLNESLKGLFPEAEKFNDITKELTLADPAVKLEAAYLVERGGAPLGIAAKASGNSYGGVTTVLVGLGLDRRIAGVRVLDTKDTPGLGANAAVPTYFVDKTSKTTFPGQFTGKALSDPFVVKEDIAAITASTITSKAITKIIKASADAAGARLEAIAMAPPAPADAAGGK
ncbi:MAG: FMN-binding protein [Spirochaetaceae bacterium]|nr:FMN-binding protein [Spirochaetaceae bacterium]